ncbi:MAG: monofunctional biosynthetic peptidoglycan transglycosylase [Pseudomonadota bacterium]
MPKESNKKPRSIRRRVFGLLVKLSVALVFISLLPVVALRWWDPPFTAFTLVEDANIRLNTWYHFPDLGTQMGLAVIAAEDQKFPTHFGFDLDSLEKALRDRQSGKRFRGASTITQQTAKNLFLWKGKNFVRKGLEAYFTLAMETTLPKRRILEIYLNIIELGPGIYGTPRASEYFFDKKPSELSASEAALLAAVLPNPKRLRPVNPTPYMQERQYWIMEQARQMQEKGLTYDLLD